MARPHEDLTGRKVNRWTVLKDLGTEGAYRQLLCKCDCGTIKKIRATSLSANDTKSCGCWARDRSTTHGKSGTVEHRAWKAIHGRCFNENNKKYPRYGGRGITVCDEWQNSFETFFDDMGLRPGNCSSIERIDNDGDYEPSNCKWANNVEQSNNRSNNRNIMFAGRIQNAKQWASELGVDYPAMLNKLNQGWSIERIAEVY
jgi:hypothetical protein